MSAAESNDLCRRINAMNAKQAKRVEDRIGFALVLLVALLLPGR